MQKKLFLRTLNRHGNFTQALMRFMKIHDKYNQMRNERRFFSSHEISKLKHLCRQEDLDLNFLKWETVMISCMGDIQIELTVPTDSRILSQMMDFFHQHNIRWATDDIFEEFYLYHKYNHLPTMRTLIYNVKNGYIIWSEYSARNPIPLEEFYRRFETLESKLNEHTIEILKENRT